MLDFKWAHLGCPADVSIDSHITAPRKMKAPESENNTVHELAFETTAVLDLALVTPMTEEPGLDPEESVAMLLECDCCGHAPCGCGG
jgi:hypothetical protein